MQGAMNRLRCHVSLYGSSLAYPLVWPYRHGVLIRPRASYGMCEITDVELSDLLVFSSYSGEEG